MSITVAPIRKDGLSSSEQPAVTPETSSPQTIIVERRDRVGLITLNRPKSLNALNGQLAIELVVVGDGDLHHVVNAQNVVFVDDRRGLLLLDRLLLFGGILCLCERVER